MYQIKKLYTKHFENIANFSNLIYIYQLATLVCRPPSPSTAWTNDRLFYL